MDHSPLGGSGVGVEAVSYTHLRAHETVLDLVCRLLLEKKHGITLETVLDLVIRQLHEQKKENKKE